MANLLTATECRLLINPPMTDAELDTVIGWVEAEITAVIGTHYVDASNPQLTETVAGAGADLFVQRAVGSIVSVTEYGSLQATSGTVLTEGTHFFVWGGQGRLERLFDDWGAYTVVVYVPQDETKKRKRAIADLVRVVVSQTALKSESVAGEYAFTAPDNWEESFRRVMRRLTFTAV